MEDLKDFLNRHYSDFDLVEDEHGTHIAFHLGGEISLLFAHNSEDWFDMIDEYVYVGDYYDSEEGSVIAVFLDNEED